MKNLKEKQMRQPLPYTQEELDEYIEGTYSWVHEHPTVLMHIVAKWVTEKFISSQLKNCSIPAVSKSFTAEEVVNELEDCDTLDDAIMFFKEQM